MTYVVPLQIGAVQGLLVASAVLGFAIAFRLLRFPDLTIEGSVPLGAATYAVLNHAGAPMPVAVAGAGLAAAAAGALTASLHVKLDVNKFLAGIIVVSIAYSLTLRVMEGPNVSLLRSASLLGYPRSLASGAWQWGLLVFLSGGLGVIAAAAIGFLRTRPGIALRAAGANPVFAASLGIGSRAAIIAGLAGSNALAGLGGVFQADYQGFADVGSGQGILVVALAALAIGEALVPRRSVTFSVHVVLAAITGSVAYHVIVAYAMRAGLKPTDLRLATGLLVLVVVALRSHGGGANEEVEPR